MSKKTLSLDLRERVVAAVSGGMSRRQAAERFGVSAASAVRWCQRQNETGSPASYKRGGDRWSARIDAHKSLILSLVEATCDIMLKELSAQLAERGTASASARCGASSAVTTLPGKKDRPCERAGPARYPDAPASVV
jgi:transposase